MDFLFGNRGVDTLFNGLSSAVVIWKDGYAHGECGGGFAGETGENEMVECGRGGGGTGCAGAESLHERDGFNGGWKRSMNGGYGALVSG